MNGSDVLKIEELHQMMMMMMMMSLLANLQLQEPNLCLTR
jgi:hypothetical protein